MKNWDCIFKTGTHTCSTGVSREWTEADLDELVGNTGADAPIVIHHPVDQGKAVNFGKIARLKRIGGELLAQYSDVPEILSMAVKEGLKLAKSVSIDPIAMKIRHVGLLGAGQPPAVAGLGPASFALGDNGGGPSITYMFNQTKENTVDPKDLKIKALEDKLAALEANKDLDKIKDDLEHAKTALANEKKAHDTTRTEFASYQQTQEDEILAGRVDALAASGRIRPVDKEKTLAFAKALSGETKTMEYSAPDGKKETVTPREMYLRDLEAVPADRDGLLTEFAKNGQSQSGPGAGKDFDFKDINSFA